MIARYLYDYGAPKTEGARRTVELFDSTVDLLRALQPLHVTPEQPVLTNTNGRLIEPKQASTTRRSGAYGQWMPAEGRSELRRFAALDSALFGAKGSKLSPLRRECRFSPGCRGDSGIALRGGADSTRLFGRFSNRPYTLNVRGGENRQSRRRECR